MGSSTPSKPASFSLGKSENCSGPKRSDQMNVLAPHFMLRFLSGELMKEEKPALSRRDKTEESIAIQIHKSELHTGASSGAVVHHVFHPRHASLFISQKFVPINTERFARSRIMIVRHVSFARHKVRLAVAV
jgi:hypothetical protein